MYTHREREREIKEREREARGMTRSAARSERRSGGAREVPMKTRRARAERGEENTWAVTFIPMPMPMPKEVCRPCS